VRTFRRELLGHGSTKPFAARRNERDFAAKAKIHC
jgi:hypothetical protein